MPVLFYILKLSVCLIIVWLFYQLVLRRLTFYTWNRWYLIVCTTLAFLLPLINISPVLEKNNWVKASFVSAIPPIAHIENTTTIIVQPKSFSEQFLNWLPYIVVIGAILMLIRLLLQYLSLLAMRRSSQLILNGPVKVYQVNKSVIPFSFGNAIYLNQHLHEQEELKEIIRHEFIHVKQRHTLDIIWSEAICILTWYNPFSWLLRKAIRQNLEFIADQQVLKTGLDRKQYQYLLLKVIGVPTYSIASNFNFKSLKKRIAMMNKVKSARLNLIRFVLLLPVIAIILVAFRNAAQLRQLPPKAVSVNDTIAPPKKSFPDNVRSFHVYNNQATVTLKNGKTESYNLDDDEQLAAFEKKYGKMPEPPIPPAAPVVTLEGLPAPDEHPMPAPTPPTTSKSTPMVDVVDAMPAPAVTEMPYQDDCYNAKGYCLKVVGTEKGSMVIILHKSRRQAELVYLEDWRKDKKFEEKYGKLPSGPPPPPQAPVQPPTPVHYDIPEGVSQMHVNDYGAVVIRTDGKVEKYNLRVAEQKAAYENKYGRQPSKIEYVAEVAHGIQQSQQAQVAVGQNSQYSPSKVKEVTVRPFDVAEYSPSQRGQNAQYGEEREILAVITNKMGFKELEQIKKELKEKDITLELTKTSLKDGLLYGVEGKVTDGNSKRHFNVWSFQKLVISRGINNKGILISVIDGAIDVIK